MIVATFLINTYFEEISPNAGKYEPEITPYLDTIHAVEVLTSADRRNLIVLE